MQPLESMRKLVLILLSSCVKLNNAILEERTSREEVEHNQAVVALAAKQAAEAEYLAAYALRVDDSENSDESDYE